MSINNKEHHVCLPIFTHYLLGPFSSYFNIDKKKTCLDVGKSHLIFTWFIGKFVICRKVPCKINKKGFDAKVKYKERWNEEGVRNSSYLIRCCDNVFIERMNWSLLFHLRIWMR